jgi:hypothetical protein
MLAAISIFLAAGLAETRDPWFWPFASDSIWNTPIGSGAVYEPAGFKRSGYIGVDQEWFFKLKKSDPIRQIKSPSDWGKRWPGDKVLGSMPVPDDLIIPDANPPHTPNACATFLMPDGRSVKQLEPTCRVEKGAQIVGWVHGEDQDLYGPGIKGTHWGSGLSAIGGSIRLGELTGPKPIRHALKLNIWGKNYLYYGEKVKGFRWPADRCDSGADKSYGGKNPKLVMGALLALAPKLSAEKLGVTTPIGRKLFAALQDYGAYVSDDSGWDAYDLCAEVGVIEEVKAKAGLELSSSNGPLFEDMQKIITALAIVDNNSPTTIGGSGRRRRPSAPALRVPN